MPIRSFRWLPITLGLALLASAHAAWTLDGRQVERSSTSRTDLSVHFTLRPGEDAVHAALDCLKTTRAGHPNVTWVDCFAYTPEGYALLFGKLQLCYSVIARWFADEDGQLRLVLAAEDRSYPARCPAPPE